MKQPTKLGELRTQQIAINLVAHAISTAPVPFQERDRVAVHFAAYLRNVVGDAFDTGRFLQAAGVAPKPKEGSEPKVTAKMLKEAKAAYDELATRGPGFKAWEDLTPWERDQWCIRDH